MANDSLNSNSLIVCTTTKKMTQAASDSDDEEEWEHVEMEKSPDDADVNRPSDEHPKADLSNGLDITIEGIKRKPGVSKEQKYLQLYLHQAHTFFLLMSAVLRNRECDHFEVQAMVLSLIPQSIHMLFGCTDDVILAGEVRQEFCSRLEQLTEWFRSEFSVARNSVYGEVENEVRGVHTLSNIVSSDTRACSSGLFVQLFCAVCRVLSLACRYVVSIQAISCKVGSANMRLRLREKEMNLNTRLVKHENEGTRKQRKKVDADPRKKTGEIPPTSWVEIYLPFNKEWIAVDPVRGIVVQSDLMQLEPKKSAFNEMVYVVALEPQSDRVKDVTRRYATAFETKTVKLRPAAEWFNDLLKNHFSYHRPLLPDAEEFEDEFLLESSKVDEPPKSISACLNHPKYVLERHLKKYECLYPKDPKLAVGHIRNELIYPRSCIQLLHTSDKWLSMEARVIKGGEIPVKVVKSRMVTKKGIRRLPSDSDDDEMTSVAVTNSPTVGLFGFWQTEPYVPEPVRDGIIPKNKYNNVDLYRPSMLPPGSVHIVEDELLEHLRYAGNPKIIGRLRFPSLKKIVNELGIDFAEAVTGFEYHGGRSVPTLKGIVVPAEHGENIRQAYLSRLSLILEEEIQHREDDIMRKWEKLIKKTLNHARLKRKFLKSDPMEHTKKIRQL